MTDQNIKLDKEFFLKNRIPILIEDEKWLELFGKAKDTSIQYCKEELYQLFKEQESIEKEIDKLEKEKSKIIIMILNISDAVNNEEKIESISLLDEYREKLIFINETIEELTYKLEMLPTQIEEMNFRLLEATVSYSYSQLKGKEEKLDKTKKQLDMLKIKIRELINIKYEYEEWISSTYTFLHGILGSEQMEKLDEIILK